MQVSSPFSIFKYFLWVIYFPLLIYWAIASITFYRIYFPSGSDEYCRLLLTPHNISFRGVGEISCRFPDLRGLKFGSFGTSRHFGSHSISEVPEAANFEFRPVPLDQREFASMTSKSAWHGTGQRRKCRLFSLLNEVAILWIRFFRQ